MLHLTLDLMLMKHVPEIDVEKPVSGNWYQFLTHLTSNLVPNFSGRPTGFW